MSKKTTGKKKLTEIIPLKTRIRLLVVWGIVVLFMLFGYLSGGSMSPLVATATFLILLLTITVAASGVVGEADELAHKLGEPYGTLILTLSILSIEVILISAVMLSSGENPTIGKDSIFSVKTYYAYGGDYAPGAVRFIYHVNI